MAKLPGSSQNDQARDRIDAQLVIVQLTWVLSAQAVYSYKLRHILDSFLQALETEDPWERLHRTAASHDSTRRPTRNLLWVLVFTCVHAYLVLSSRRTFVHGIVQWYVWVFSLTWCVPVSWDRQMTGRKIVPFDWVYWVLTAPPVLCSLTPASSRFGSH